MLSVRDTLKSSFVRTHLSVGRFPTRFIELEQPLVKIQLIAKREVRPSQ
jgi:hypothetical protein